MYNLTYVDSSPLFLDIVFVFPQFLPFPPPFSAAPRLIVVHVFCFRYARSIFLVSVSRGMLLGRVSVIHRENIVTLVRKARYIYKHLKISTYIYYKLQMFRNQCASNSPFTVLFHAILFTRFFDKCFVSSRVYVCVYIQILILITNNELMIFQSDTFPHIIT